MRILVGLMLVASCMHDLEVRAPEVCASHGMVVSGYNGEDPQCARPQTPVEMCQVNAASVSLRNRQEYGTGGRNTLLFFGYAAFIVPGVLFHIFFNIERNIEQDDADAKLAKGLAQCGR